MSLSVALALCCAGAPAPAVAFRPLEGLFLAGDYPALALEAGQSGEVTVRLLVNTNGRVQECTVLRSSGVSILDSTTCRILRSRGRFIPPSGEDGARMPSQLDYVHRWALPVS